MNRKAYIDGTDCYFNSNSKGLIKLGNIHQAALWGFEDCPSGWETLEILSAAGCTDEFFNSADAISDAINSFSNDWLAETLYELWTQGRVISHITEERVEKQVSIDRRIDTASWAPQSGSPIEIEYYTTEKRTIWSVDGVPFVTVKQKHGPNAHRAVEIPALTRKKLGVVPSIQIECTSSGIIEI